MFEYVVCGGQCGLVFEKGHYEEDVTVAAVYSLAVAFEQPPSVLLVATAHPPVRVSFFRGVEVQPLHDAFFGVVVLVAVLHAEFALDGGVPVVFDGVVGPAGQPLGDECPFVANST